MLNRFIKKINRQIEIYKLNKMDLKDLEKKLNFLKEFHFRFQIANIGLPLAQEAAQNQKEEIKLLETIINKKRGKV